MQKVQLDKKALILVATSGDTGKAALEGFRDVAVSYTHLSCKHICCLKS